MNSKRDVHAAGTDDLRHLVKRSFASPKSIRYLMEREEGFVCTSCGDPVWALPP